jgi:excinuclease ABC subunit A
MLAVTLGNDERPTEAAGRGGPAPIRHSSFVIRNSKIPGLSIMDFCSLSVDRADEFLSSLKLTEFQQKIAGELIKEIRARLGFLKNVGRALHSR